jgi:hypothetical protein
MLSPRLEKPAMSFYPPDQGPPEQPYDPYDPSGLGDRPQGPGFSREAGLEKLKPPAIGMICAAAVNLIAALFAFIVGLIYAAIPASEIEKILAQQQPENLRQFKNMGWSVQDIMNLYVYGGIGEGIAGIVSGIIGLIAGILMLRGKAFGFAVFGSIVMAIPVISCSGCCGLGEAMGIWSLVILFNEEVKAAFQ